jgi:acetyl esterase/lipase
VYGSVPSFAFGWPVGELAPQFAALTVADAAARIGRGRMSKLGLGVAAATVGALGYAAYQASQAGDVIEDALKRDLGDDYYDLPADREIDSPGRTLNLLARPFSPGRPNVEVIRNINYTDGGQRAKLDVYRPADGSAKNAPVLIQIHGGGWTIGKKEEQGLMLMNRLAELGWVCVAANYRLSPKHRFPDHIVDVKKAIAWVRANIGEYGGDPSYLVLTGGSAGGHLSSLAALTPNERAWQPGFERADTSVAACVPFYGVYDMFGEDNDPYTIGLRDDMLSKRVFPLDPPATMDDYRDASPIHQIHPDAPDFFVLHGENDTLVSVRQARAFVAKLRSKTPASVTYAELPGAQHAFEVFGSIRSDHAIRAAVRWCQWHRERWLKSR